MPPSIRVVGSLNADMVSVTPRCPEAGETITSSAYFTSAGGKGANQAVACGRMSRAASRGQQQQQQPPASATTVRVEMAGAVGGLDGHFEALLKPTLEQSGVDTSRVQIIDTAYTGVAVIIVDESAGGENRILFSPGANYQGMRATPAVLGMALAAPVPDVIILQAEIPVATVIGTLREIAAYRRRRRRVEGKRGIEVGPDVMFNPAPAPPGGLPEDVYEGVDHLIMNETEAELMAPPGRPASGRDQVARYFHQLGVRYVVVTLGSKGVWYSATDAGEGSYRATNEMPAAQVSKVLDTTAAGDTFVGAYAVSVARWREQRRGEGKAGLDLSEEEKVLRYTKVLDEAMEVSTRASARCVERQGAMDSIPWEDEICPTLRDPVP